MQFFKIAAYVQVAQSYGFVALCDLCILPYIHGLRSCSCLRGSLGCLCVLGLYGHLGRESVSVFDGLVYL